MSLRIHEKMENNQFTSASTTTAREIVLSNVSSFCLVFRPGGIPTCCLRCPYLCVLLVLLLVYLFFCSVLLLFSVVAVVGVVWQDFKDMIVV